ncbi:response regulator [Aurantiacibacter poecillastricola]|uniref:response regulator n=1 Tax=Aurantiacibacter poecillastricola TaxID=3064385 RepID=UPI00273EE003|nr:response regulator [Aurantiacibacter sp. 219JJ12-13]MDP5261909.1 response regulator [Aurantiacibacter sp. 219JJ12-13]
MIRSAQNGAAGMTRSLGPEALGRMTEMAGSNGTNATPQYPAIESGREPTNATSPFSGGPTRLGHAKLLIAESRADKQQQALFLATSLGMTAHVVCSGEDAVRAVVEAKRARSPFTVVLMNTQMPGVGGLEATRLLRALGFDANSLPVIALVPKGFQNDVEAFPAAGMQSHIEEPITPLAVARELARWTHPAPANLPLPR